MNSTEQNTAPDFSGLKAVFINATLKRSPEPSHTDGLVRLLCRPQEGP